MLKISLYAFLIAGISSLAFIPSRFSDKQPPSIRGVLVDKGTREAIPFSNVALYRDTVLINITTTNMDGEFYFKNLPAGKYSATATYIGYNRQTLKNIVVKDSLTAFIWLELSVKEGAKLDEVEIVNYTIPLIDPDTKSGQTITREDYQNLGTKNISPAATTPGVYQPNESKTLNTHGGKKDKSRKTNYYPAPKEEPGNEEYAVIKDNTFKNAKKDPLSTFSIDVDKAAYSNIRRFISKGSLPPADAVRIEEMINYFAYNYPQPKTGPFSISTQYADCPWNSKHQLVHIGIQGKEINTGKMPANNLVFLLDVSGSMADPDKLPLLKSGLRLLVDQLREEDHVAIVVYAGAAGVVLPSTRGNEKEKIISAIENLSAGGSTAGGEGIVLAYKLAKQNFLSKGNNRVILATDGDFNVGVSSDDG